MEWMNRGDRPAPTTQAAPSTSSSRKNLKGSGFLKWVTLVLLVAVAVVILALVAYISLGNTGKPEGNYVDKGKLQAVFLNGGQVYFGNIKGLNDKYLRLDNIYYLRVNQTVQPNGSTSSNQDISLVKLGCELHGPVDEMLINRDQVVFWENLKTDGQVAKAVDAYVKQNPSGQNCNQSSSSSSSSSTTPTDNSGTGTGTNTTTTGGTSTTGTTKK